MYYDKVTVVMFIIVMAYGHYHCFYVLSICLTINNRKDSDWCLFRFLLCGFLLLVSLQHYLIVLLSCLKSAFSLKRSRKFQPEDRLFSLSSVTSPVSVLEITY